jgi:pilus assembly protein CpaC
MRIRASLALGAAVPLALATTLLASTGADAQVGRRNGASPAATASASVGNRTVQVNTGRGQLVTLSAPMTDLFVADPQIADVQVRSATQLYVFGKKPGETTVSATSRSGQVVFSATVRVGNNYDSIGAMLGLAMPDAQVVATPMNGLVLLTGTVAGPADAAEAERLVQAYVGEATKVISRLKTATPLQVSLQVRVAEVRRGFFKNVGVNLTSLDRSGGFLFGVASGRNPGSITPGANGTGYSFTQGTQRSTLGLAGSLLGLDILGAIDLGETTGQVSTLQNTNLLALSGETATFLAGGEFPIPIAQALGTVSIEYKPYGVSLAYTPTVLSDGRISIRVRPEVSELDFANAVTLGGTRIPGLVTRRAETTAELGSGESIMIGGLMSNSHNSSIDKTPGLGNIPILGALFRSNSWQRNETELVIIITPYLVKPMGSPRDVALPTDGYKAATDLGRVLLGQNEAGQTGAVRPIPTVALPTAPAPTIGAVMPARPIATRSTVAAPAPGRGKGALPTPGFSN